MKGVVILALVTLAAGTTLGAPSENPSEGYETPIFPPETKECWESEEKELEELLETADLDELQKELDKALGAPSNQIQTKPNVVCLLRSLGAFFTCVRDLRQNHSRAFHMCAVKNWRKFSRCFHQK